MDRFILNASKLISVIAGLSLTVMMFLTFSDVALRALKRPIVGTYEMVSLLLALVVALGLPQVSLERGHVYMEFVVERLKERTKRIVNTATRLCVIFLFVLGGIYLLDVGSLYKKSKEVTATMKIPFYPFAYTCAICCFMQSLVLIREVVNLWRKRNE